MPIRRKRRTTRAARKRRHARIRKRVHGTAARPRLAVFRSLNHIYGQIIDDDLGQTLAAASDLNDVAGSKTERAAVVGKQLAGAAQAAGVLRRRLRPRRLPLPRARPRPRRSRPRSRPRLLTAQPTTTTRSSPCSNAKTEAAASAVTAN